MNTYTDDCFEDVEAKDLWQKNRWIYSLSLMRGKEHLACRITDVARKNNTDIVLSYRIQIDSISEVSGTAHFESIENVIAISIRGGELRIDIDRTVREDERVSVLKREFEPR